MKVYHIVRIEPPAKGANDPPLNTELSCLLTNHLEKMSKYINLKGMVFYKSFWADELSERRKSQNQWQFLFKLLHAGLAILHVNLNLIG